MKITMENDWYIHFLKDIPECLDLSKRFTLAMNNIIYNFNYKQKYSDIYYINKPSYFSLNKFSLLENNCIQFHLTFNSIFEDYSYYKEFLEILTQESYISNLTVVSYSKENKLLKSFNYKDGKIIELDESDIFNTMFVSKATMDVKFLDKKLEILVFSDKNIPSKDSSIWLTNNNIKTQEDFYDYIQFYWYEASSKEIIKETVRFLNEFDFSQHNDLKERIVSDLSYCNWGLIDPEIKKIFSKHYHNIYG